MTIDASYYCGNKAFSVERKTTPPPAQGEVQIDVAYCGLCGTDIHIFHGHMDARTGDHRIIGHEMSGVISRLGPGVEGFEPGQSVVVRPLIHCGDCPTCRRGYEHICQNLKFIGIDTDGALQEKWNVPAHTVHIIPEGLSLKHAALAEPLAVACHDVRRARVAKGEDVLIIGGGPIGILIGLVARHLGANVVISEINETRIEIAEAMGFTTVNPKKVDVGAALQAMTDTKGMDVVFEVSGVQAGIDLMTEAAATRARICMVAIHASKPQVDLFQFFWKELEMLGARVYEADDYEMALGLLADGKIPADTIITDLRGLDEVGDALGSLTSDPTMLKTLIQVGAHKEAP